MIGKKRYAEKVRADKNYTPHSNVVWDKLLGVKSPGAKLVFFYMLSNADHFHPTQKKIAKETGVCQSQIPGFQKELEEAGLIRLSRPQLHRRIKEYELILNQNDDIGPLLDNDSDTKEDTLDHNGDTEYHNGDTEYQNGDTEYQNGDTKYSHSDTNNITKSSLIDEPSNEVVQEASEKSTKISGGNGSATSNKKNGPPETYRPPYESYVPSGMTLSEKTKAPKLPKETEEERYAKVKALHDRIDESDKIQKKNRDRLERREKF